jgi:hypothetical protein
MASNEQQSPERNEKSRADFGYLLAMGMIFGMLVGMLVDNLGLGIALGMPGATVANAYQERKQNARGASLALAIGLVSLIVVVAIWLLSL